MVLMGNEDGGSPWLKPLLKTSFFRPCRVHGGAHKGECNMYCLDCMGGALCSSCLAHHKHHRVVQIRRSSYHNVIRASEASKFTDISHVQTYVINGAKVVFLNERPQLRPGKAAANACEACGRALLDAFRFCSLGCKVEGTKRDTALASELRLERAREMGSGSDSDDSSSSPRKLRETASLVRRMDIAAVSSAGAGEGELGRPMSSVSPATPPLVSYRTGRRKGTPRRAPF